MTPLTCAARDWTPEAADFVRQHGLGDAAAALARLVGETFPTGTVTARVRRLPADAAGGGTLVLTAVVPLDPDAAVAGYAGLLRRWAAEAPPHPERRLVASVVPAGGGPLLRWSVWEGDDMQTVGPGTGCCPYDLAFDPTMRLVYLFEAAGYVEAMLHYNGWNGWEPYKPMEPPHPTAAEILARYPDAAVPAE